ncbi:hypothetical protein [Halodurantibacterium flavum]|uniref:Uncharacterized protein n=1 Tax=Halodurantibacterium flavum TaxID=1382802 RepID=A0ABW4S997_9RHOB
MPNPNSDLRVATGETERLAPLILTPDLRVVPRDSSARADIPETPFSPPPPFLTAGATPINAFAPAAGPDPDALRDMVAELVRQELRGSLGVQITHTVRKLVRAEIARALAARDLR